MAKALVSLSCLLLVASGVSSKPFFFGNSGGVFGNPLFGGLGQSSSPQGGSSAFHRLATTGLQTGLNFAGTGLNAMNSMTSNIPVFGTGFSSMANMAQSGLGTVGAFGMGGLNGIESHRQSIMSASPGKSVSQSFSSQSSSVQAGSNPPQTVSSSVTTITKS